MYNGRKSHEAVKGAKPQLPQPISDRLVRISGYLDVANQSMVRYSPSPVGT